VAQQALQASAARESTLGLPIAAGP